MEMLLNKTIMKKFITIFIAVLITIGLIHNMHTTYAAETDTKTVTRSEEHTSELQSH